ncbi:hypothetical protein Rsub_05590 [Raphidocelis subcapitata]|uniref:E3 ubiquitin-protein ligase RNF170 n=1 Tax=Raphidocelis subcapitata TaxID=307507 RepID=A0A2V0NXM5_9CHLO|nr:hypothetical protein Rsub_05590 [Raphidocelis subcapitata]|eukprot:GBF92388.1 hypothetical protein Rsub_05590 [Raphidocelis subcapitata]
MALDSADDDLLSCPVCFQPFDTDEHKPWSLGCGHSFCEACLRAHPRSFRSCPECRSRAGTPHVNISLLRLLGAAPRRGGGGGGDGAPPLPGGGVMTRRQRQQRDAEAAAAAASAPPLPGGRQQQQQQQQQQQPSPADLVLGARRDGGSAVGAAVALAAAVQQALNQRGGAPQHDPEAVAWKASVWTWLGPALALAYILSPLDLIPDIMPLIGWVDDALVAVWLAAALWGRLAGGRAGFGAARRRGRA